MPRRRPRPCGALLIPLVRCWWIRALVTNKGAQGESLGRPPAVPERIPPHFPGPMTWLRCGPCCQLPELAGTHHLQGASSQGLLGPLTCAVRSRLDGTPSHQPVISPGGRIPRQMVRRDPFRQLKPFPSHPIHLGGTAPFLIGRGCCLYLGFGQHHCRTMRWVNNMSFTRRFTRYSPGAGGSQVDGVVEHITFWLSSPVRRRRLRTCRGCRW